MGHVRPVESLWIVIPLGLVAGALTTVAGVGGGVLLTLVLSVVAGPHAALAIVAPPLLLGNVHRLWLMRRDVDRSIALRLGLPAGIGALLGGAVAAALPAESIRWVMLGIAALAIARELGLLTQRVPRAWLLPGGVLVGVLSATSGGGGLVLAPLLLATGLRGAAFVATGAVVASAIHVGRISAYGTTGLLGVELLPAIALLGAAILVGNTIGLLARARIPEPLAHRITWLTLLASIVIALLGVASGG